MSSDTQIEEQPGYLGHIVDGEYSLPPEWQFARSFFEDEFEAIVDEQQRNINRSIHVRSATTSFNIHPNEDYTLIDLLTEIPGISVYTEPLDDEDSPACGSCMVLLLDATSDLQTATDNLASAISALRDLS
jgi:hypothetical protein